MALEKALEVAKNEQLDEDIKKDYNALLKNIESLSLLSKDDLLKKRNDRYLNYIV